MSNQHIPGAGVNPISAPYADGEQPSHEQAANHAESLDSLTEDQLRAALYGEAPENPTEEADQQEQSANQSNPQSVKPQEEEEDHNAPNPEAQAQPKNLRRVSLSAIKDEAQKQEIAEALALIGDGQAVDIVDALNQLRGNHQLPAANAEDEKQPEQSPAPEPLETKINSLRDQYDEAEENFDRPEMRRLNAEIQQTLVDMATEKTLATINSREENQHQASYQQELDAAYDKAEEKYPAMTDEGSAFYRLLDDKVTAAQSRNDSALRNPNFILSYAEEIAALLGERKPASRPSPAPVKASAPVGSRLAPGHSSPAVMTEDQARHAMEQMTAEELEAVLYT